MWIQLTKANGVAFILNTDFITQISEVAGGGVQVTSSLETTDTAGKIKPKIYRATENIQTVMKALDKTPSARARG